MAIEITMPNSRYSKNPPRSHTRSRGETPPSQNSALLSENESEDSAPLPKTIRVRNLSRNVKETHIHEIFSNWGTLKNVTLPSDSKVNISLGYCIVEYETGAQAKEALASMNGGQVDGKTVEISLVIKKKKSGVRRRKPTSKSEVHCKSEGRDVRKPKEKSPLKRSPMRRKERSRQRSKSKRRSKSREGSRHPRRSRGRRRSRSHRRRSNDRRREGLRGRVKRPVKERRRRSPSSSSEGFQEAKYRGGKNVRRTYSSTSSER